MKVIYFLHYNKSSSTRRSIFGVGIGIIIMAMRLWGWLPEGTTFAIIGMNLLVPLINRYTKPKPKEKAV